MVNLELVDIPGTESVFIERKRRNEGKKEGRKEERRYNVENIVNNIVINMDGPKMV